MLVTLDIKQESMVNSFLNFIKTLDYVDIKNNIEIPIINKNNKFSEFAGMWEDRDITIETIREKAWKR